MFFQHIYVCLNEKLMGVVTINHLNEPKRVLNDEKKIQN